MLGHDDCLIEQVTEILAYDQQVAAIVLIDKTVEDLVYAPIIAVGWTQFKHKTIR